MSFSDSVAGSIVSSSAVGVNYPTLGTGSARGENSVAIGYGTVCIGYDAVATMPKSVIIGNCTVGKENELVNILNKVIVTVDGVTKLGNYTIDDNKDLSEINLNLKQLCEQLQYVEMRLLQLEWAPGGIIYQQLVANCNVKELSTKRLERCARWRAKKLYSDH